MADQFAILHTTADTGGGTQDFDLSLDDFSAAIILVSTATALATNTSRGVLSVGYVEADLTERCHSHRASDGNISNPEGRTFNSTARCIVIGTNSGTGRVAEASMDSLITGGFRINWDVTPPSAFRITVVGFGGLTNEAVGHDSPPAAAAELSVGFQPDVVFFTTTSGTTSAMTANADAQPSFGFAINDGTPTQHMLQTVWEFGGTLDVTDADSIIRNDRAGGELNTGTSDAFQVTSFTANGWNRVRDSGTPLCQYLAIKFSETRTVAAAIETLPGGTGSQAFTGLGIRSAICLGMSNLLTTTGSVVDGPTAATATYSVFTASAQYTYASHEEENIDPSVGTPSNANSRVDATPLTVYDEAGATAIETTFTSMDSTGFTFNFSKATAGRMVVLGIQQLAISQVLTETVEVSDAYVTHLIRTRTVDDAVDVSDSYIAHLVKLREISDTVEVSDSYVTVKTVVGLHPREGTTLEAGAVAGATLQDGGALGSPSEAEALRGSTLEASALVGSSLEAQALVGRTMQ